MPFLPHVAISTAAIPDAHQRQRVSEALSRVLGPLRDGPWTAELATTETGAGGAGGDTTGAWTLWLYNPAESAIRSVPARDQNVRGLVRVTQSALFTKWPRRPRPAVVAPATASAAARRRR